MPDETQGSTAEDEKPAPPPPNQYPGRNMGNPPPKEAAKQGRGGRGR